MARTIVKINPMISAILAAVRSASGVHEAVSTD
jgi:hypothetical protein